MCLYNLDSSSNYKDNLFYNINNNIILYSNILLYLDYLNNRLIGLVLST